MDWQTELKKRIEACGQAVIDHADEPKESPDQYIL